MSNTWSTWCYSTTTKNNISGGGGGGISTVYNNAVRYLVTSGDDAAQLLSTGTLYAGLSWSRSGTTITITSTAHGLSAGDFVVIRNMSEDYSYLEIQTVPTVNTFTLTVANSGGTSGTEGAYIPAFDVSTLTEAALTIESPSAGNCQLISMTWFIYLDETDPKTLTVPSNAISNGAGGNSSLKTRIPPDVRAYDVSSGTDSSWITTATTQFVNASGHNVYNITGNLGTFYSTLITLNF